MRTAFGLFTSLSLVLLAPACPGGGGGETDNASTGGPTGGPTGDLLRGPHQRPQRPPP